MSFSEFTTLETGKVLLKLKASTAGLTSSEVKKRLEKYGYNQIKSHTVSVWNILINQFKTSFIYLLIFAVIISFIVGEFAEGIIILIFIVINSALGFLQEYRSNKALKKLQKYFVHSVVTLRNHKETIVPQNMLVPGDIIMLKSGDIVPADIRIIEQQNLLVDESALSGESNPLNKQSATLDKPAKDYFQARNILFSGTTINSGIVKGIIIATGKESEMGNISKLAIESVKKSPLAEDLFKFSRALVKIVIFTLVAVFAANYLIKGSTENIISFLIFSIALAVSIIPEILPTITTVSLSSGALKLAKKSIIVKRLASIYDLGSIDILCTDKTGTITENKLKIKNIYSQDKKLCLKYAFYGSEINGSSPNPFDTALSQNFSKSTRSKINKIYEIPFDNIRKFNSVLVEINNKKIIIARGAPENIFSICHSNFKNIKLSEFKKFFLKEGSIGRRVIAVAYKAHNKSSYSHTDENKLILLGLISFSDPLKPTSKQAIKKANKINVQVKILTGDSSEVAANVAQEVGLINDRSEVITGQMLKQANPVQLIKIVEQYNVFARINPEDKYKIISLLQKKYTVGFLGEGINDAPALKIANTSMVVPGASQIAKEVADILLLKRSLLVIINCILEGRNIFTNITKYIKTTLASNFGNFYSLAIISLFIPFLPMLPIQILLLNLISDAPMLAISSDKVDTEELKKPKHYNIKEFIYLVLILGVVSSLFDFIFFSIFRNSDETTIQTLWFILSILTEIILIFSLRTRFTFFKAKFASKTLILLSSGAILSTFIFPYTNFGRTFFKFDQPQIFTLLILVGLVGGYFIINEIIKSIYYKFIGKASATQ